MAGQNGLQPRAALGERQAADILARIGQEVVGADPSRKGRGQLGVDGLAVQPLLQVGERGDPQPPRRVGAQDQQLPVDHALEAERVHHVGKGARDLVAGPAVEPGDPALPHRLHADPVPLPFRRVVLRVEPGEVHRLVDRLGQHDGAEAARRGGRGTLGPPFQPGEQLGVGRLQRVPDLLDLGDLDDMTVGHGDVGGRLLGQPGGETDPQLAGEQLQQGPARLGVLAGVQPAFQQGLGLVPVRAAQRVDHLRKVRLAVRPGVPGPDQGDRLGQVADIVVGPPEQLRVDPRLHRLADHRRLGGVERQGAGQGRQRPAALRVRLAGQVVPHQPKLGVPGRSQREPVEQRGEGAHWA